jgi:hypothetical protein
MGVNEEALRDYMRGEIERRTQASSGGSLASDLTRT